MKKMIHFKTIALALVLCSSFGVAACTSTMHGAGQDIERAGENVQDATD